MEASNRDDVLLLLLMCIANENINRPSITSENNQSDGMIRVVVIVISCITKLKPTKNLFLQEQKIGMIEMA